MRPSDDGPTPHSPNSCADTGGRSAHDVWHDEQLTALAALRTSGETDRATPDDRGDNIM